MWCPAHAYLETRKIDKPVGYFCNVTHFRAELLKKQLKPNGILVAPIKTDSGYQEMTRFNKSKNKIIKEELGQFVFVPLVKNGT